MKIRNGCHVESETNGTFFSPVQYGRQGFPNLAVILVDFALVGPKVRLVVKLWMPGKIFLLIHQPLQSKLLEKGQWKRRFNPELSCG